ncbi:MAG: nucleotidyltransferase domain-containing protein [Bacteroides sp.]|nr:nucleotidyltransferase domain-containing protein [Bacteroides sp.]
MALHLFGSVARGNNRPDSDIAILVSMPPKIFTFSAIHRFLETAHIRQASLDFLLTPILGHPRRKADGRCLFF